MATTTENVCCRKRQPIGDCVLLDDDMATVVLNHHVVKTAVSAARDQYADDIHQNYDNNRMRFQAYNQYVMATAGHTGSGNRIVIPSCVVSVNFKSCACFLLYNMILLLQIIAVRNKWPDANGQYVGFRKSQKQIAAEFDLPMEVEDSD